MLREFFEENLIFVKGLKMRMQVHEYPVKGLECIIKTSEARVQTQEYRM
jgi:hypothetical protein